MSSTRSLWAILLAGGEGTRLRGEVIAGERVDRPKQFLRMGQGISLLGATLERALRLVPASNVVPVVSAAHRSWWTPELGLVPGENILAQPLNRGTAVAVLLGLIHILRRDDDPTIFVLPCDHGVADERPLVEATRRAAALAGGMRGDLVLLGVRPTHPEIQYGWILPEVGVAGSPRAVRSFIEKPSYEAASALMNQGALWNTLIFAASGSALREAYLRVVPDVLRSCLGATARTESDGEAWVEFFRDVPTLDFGRDVLQRAPAGLRVIHVPECGWTDLGTPARVAAWLDRKPLERNDPRGRHGRGLEVAGSRPGG
jgi:mannose-1-phosphate guanylyltransferase